MWIRSQDRLKLINSYSYNRIKIEDILSIIVEKHDYVIVAYRNEDKVILGTYTSEDNAIDTLAYIQECIYLGKAEMNMPLEKDGELLK